MSNRIDVGGLKVDAELHRLVAEEMTPGTGVDPDAFWTALGEIIRDLSGKNKALIAERETIQSKIDAWHQERAGQDLYAVAYKSFLSGIGYLRTEGAAFKVDVSNVD